MKFQQSEIFDKLTIIITARNLVNLHYTFIESLWSAIPIGCRFLVGNFESEDETVDYYQELAKYVPIKIITRPWASKSGLTAIGLATQYLIDEAETEYVYNLQACEVLCEETPQTIIDIFSSPELDKIIPIMKFQHFFGNCRFEGTIGGHAYNHAQRLMHKTADATKGDGCHPIINHNRQNYAYLGMVHRYSYCFKNQVYQKVHNHAKYFGASIQSQFSNIEWCRLNPNYYGSHPQYVSHMINNDDYSAADGLTIFKSNNDLIY